MRETRSSTNQYTCSGMWSLRRGKHPGVESLAFPRPASDTSRPLRHGSKGQRERSSFTFRRVLSIAITVELVSLGFVPSRAGLLAFVFTDVELPGMDLDF